MYFNEKDNTNIDHQFKDNKNLNKKLNFEKTKPLIYAGSGLITLIILIIVIVVIINNRSYTIELQGEEIMTIAVGSEYIEPGYKAYDKKNNDKTNQIKVEKNIDTSKEGEYEIIYKIGNTSKIRYITVVKTVDESYIYLNGKMTMYLELGEKYVEPGYRIYDSIDKDLTNKVIISGKVNTSKIGTYHITYSVTNSRNKKTTIKRTIIVVEKGKKPNN